jgi:hypothetical protein
MADDAKGISRGNSRESQQQKPVEERHTPASIAVLVDSKR